MGLDVKQFTEGIIRPALHALDLYSLAAEELLIGTALHESGKLKYVCQLNCGPALGLFQMEPATHQDIWRNFIAYRRSVKQSLALSFDCTYGKPEDERLIYDMRYAAAMCRLHYYRVPTSLPAPGDVYGQAAYWKAHYNTHKGKGRVEDYVETYMEVMHGHIR